MRRECRSVSLTNDVREVTACLINKSDAYLFSLSPSRCACAHGQEVFLCALISLFPALSLSLAGPMLIQWTMNRVGQIAQRPMFVK